MLLMLGGGRSGGGGGGGGKGRGGHGQGLQAGLASQKGDALAPIQACSNKTLRLSASLLAGDCKQPVSGASKRT